jgi:hypothetical protein
MTIRVNRTTLVLVVSVVALVTGGAVLRAQAQAGQQVPIGVIDLYAIEEQAPQFVEARAHVAEYQAQLDAAMQVASPYRFLRAEELNTAIALQRAGDTRTRQQREQLEALMAEDEKRATRYRELLTLPADQRIPATDAEFADLGKLYDECEATQNALIKDARGKLALGIRQYEEKVSSQLDKALDGVAKQQGLALILEKRVRTENQAADPTLASLGYQYRRIVHYGGTDVTKEVLAELVRLNNEANGVPGT